MNRKEFLEELKTYGFEITSKYYEGLFLNGMRISNSEYEHFGYRCGGEYNPLGETKKVEFDGEDLKATIRNCRAIYDKEIKGLKLQITFHDIKEFLQSRNVSKVENQASERVLKVVLDNYQEIYRNKISNLKPIYKFIGK